MKTLTFEDVQKSLRAEVDFLEKTKIGKDDEIHSAVLKACFEASPTTKRISEVVDNRKTVNEYAVKYPACKFITESQLERICEQYNLFCRQTRFFTGEIPEKNLKEISKFYVFAEDADLNVDIQRNIIDKFGTRINITDFSQSGLLNSMLICALKSQFLKSAFFKSHNRIETRQEREATGQVNCDPIVIFRCKNGYLILTAWQDGDIDYFSSDIRNDSLNN